MELQAQPETTTAWQGKACAKLPGTDAGEAWSLLSDFCSLHRWIPSMVHICRRVAGPEGQPGCIRYCASPPDAENPIWAYEELLAFDPAARALGYKVGDNNAGLKRFVVTFKVLPAAAGGGGGSELEWSFDCDPADGWTEESITAFLQNGLDEMARNVEEEARRLRVAAAATSLVVD